METRANYVWVGLFALMVMLLAFALVWFTARLGDSRNLLPLDIRIPGSVTGLGESSAVYFNGIRVGQVRRLEFDDSNPGMVIAKAEINATTPITRSTQATLGFQGLTGLAFVELQGGSLGEPNLLQEAEREGAVARIDADPSSLNNLLATAQDIFTRADEAISQLEIFVKNVRDPLTKTVHNVERFTATLDENRDDIDVIISTTRQMMSSLANASTRVDSIMDKLDVMLSPDNENSVIVHAQETLASIARATDTLNRRIDPIADNIERFSAQGLRELQALIGESRRSVTRIEQAIGELEKNPQRLLFGGGGSVPEYDGRRRR